LRDAELGVPVLLETNGVFADRIESILSWIDIVSMDVKLPSNSGEPPQWNEHAEFLRRSRSKTVYVKVPVDEKTHDDEFERAAQLVAEVDRRMPFFIQPILSPTAELEVTGPRLREFYDRATRHLEDVRVLPQAHRFLGIA
ncbi:MAG: 7-carboxy-7-deazaguanine synthase QueE, partial [Candidatus Binatia bacterium]